MTMTFLITLLFAVSIFSNNVFADELSFDIRLSGEERPSVVWSVELIEINKDTGISRFGYTIDGESKEFEAHYTRIFSIIIKPPSEMRADFPKRNFGPRLSDPRPSLRRNDYRRLILLSNSGGQASSVLPEKTLIEGSRDGSEIIVRGNIVSFDVNGAMVIEIFDKKQVRFEVKINSLLLISWIRG